MSKRGNENSQLRPDEVERLNDESDEEAGTFKRASTEELAKRKIVKVRRPGGATESKPPPVVAAAAPSVANPFSGFGGLVAPSSVPAAAVANPFANFGGLVAPSSVALAPAPTNPFSNFKGLVAPTSAPAAPTPAPAPAPAPAVSEAPKTSKLVEDLADSEHKKKMKKLNNSFLSWTSRQIENHPVTGWKDGVKDYIKYAKDIAEKYPEDESAVVKTSPSTAASAAAPLPAFSFLTGTAKKDEDDKKPVAAPVAFSFPAGTAKKDEDEKKPVAAPVAFSFPTGTAKKDEDDKKPVAAPVAFSFPTGTAKKDEDEKKPVAPASTFSFLTSPVVPSAPAAAKKDEDDKKPAVFFGGPVVNSFTGANPFSTSSPFTFNTSTTAGAPASAAAAPAATTTAFGGFGSSNFSFPTAAAASGAAVAGDDGEEGGDDEGEPILEPEKVLKNQDDTDDILFEGPCKLFNFSKESNEWKDTGKGTFRITQSITDKKQRMLVRNPIGKLTFNAGFYKSMKVEKVKGGVTFAAWVVADEATVGGVKNTAAPELKKFMLKLKDVDIAVAQQKMEAAIAALP